MVVILLIRKDRDEPWKGRRRNEVEQGGGCHPIIEPSTGYKPMVLVSYKPFSIFRTINTNDISFAQFIAVCSA
jgi:hypothetical protein